MGGKASVHASKKASRSELCDECALAESVLEKRGDAVMPTSLRGARERENGPGGPKPEQRKRSPQGFAFYTSGLRIKKGKGPTVLFLG